MATEAPCCHYAFTIGVSWIRVSQAPCTPTLLTNILISSFYFPGAMVGPSIEYVTYASLVDGSLFESAEKEPGPARYVPRGRKRVAYTRMASSFICMGVFVVFGGKYHYETILKDEWLQKGFLER